MTAWLLQASAIVGALSVFLVFIGLLSRTVVGRKVKEWVSEDVEEFIGTRAERALDRQLECLPERLDKALAFNGTGSFRADMRIFYLSTTEFMAESHADRLAIHKEIAEKFPPKGNPPHARSHE